MHLILRLSVSQSSFALLILAIDNNLIMKIITLLGFVFVLCRDEGVWTMLLWKFYWNKLKCPFMTVCPGLLWYTHSNMRIFIWLLLTSMVFGDSQFSSSPSWCDYFDFALVYGYPQAHQYGYLTEICYKFEISSNPSYQCQYTFEYFVLDMHVTFYVP